jgi:hypothetical protein
LNYSEAPRDADTPGVTDDQRPSEPAEEQPRLELVPTLDEPAAEPTSKDAFDGGPTRIR